MKFITKCYCSLCNVKVENEVKHLMSKNHMKNFNKIINHMIGIEEIQYIFDEKKVYDKIKDFPPKEENQKL